MSNAYFIGIDIGTQGARVVLLDESGEEFAAESSGFLLTENLRIEQSPESWWQACSGLIKNLTWGLEHTIDLNKVKAIAVTSTSGTIIPIDKNCNPLHPALMYSDPRSGPEAKLCKEVAVKEVKEGYTAFNASSGLPKMLWFLNQYPELVPAIHKFIHAADFITGRLCGEYNVTDYTNALKSGYDLHNNKWPDYIDSIIGIHKKWLQTVRPSGVPVARLNAELAALWGLPTDVMVTTGVTDGCASQIASGAMNPGQWNTTIGTTLVIKGVTSNEIKDPSDAIYNHRHPEGYWMPGGASNTGADWVSKMFAGQDLHVLGLKAGEQLPSSSMAWPLLQQGERFPFVAPNAKGFWLRADALPGDESSQADNLANARFDSNNVPLVNNIAGNADLFAACMEGVAFIERYAYEKIMQLSGEKVENIYSAGGGSDSDTWLKIRSAVTRIPVYKMKNVSGAAGAAILAASKTYYHSLQQAASAMVKPALIINP
ncbi:MAG: carbohydrate kinase, partial [Sphingobacteriales bacterium]